jgi:hypothetical protein
MMKWILSLIGFWSFYALAIPCDCEVRVHSPLTGPTNLSVYTAKTYTLEGYSSFSPQNQRSCRASCLREFQQEMSLARLNAILVTYSQELIAQGQLGFNCTGLTTLKYPVRVRALLGQEGLGNVWDAVQIINHEEICF